MARTCLTCSNLISLSNFKLIICIASTAPWASMSSATRSSGAAIRMNLPLLPSERERLHKQRVRGGVSQDGDDGVDEARGVPDKSNVVDVGGNTGGAVEVSSQTKEKLKASDREASPNSSQTQESEIERRRKNMDRIRQYQQKTFSHQAPLPMSTTSRVLQDVLLSSSQFLNSYVADASSRLEESSADISALERQMGLLEGKLSSLSTEGSGAEGNGSNCSGD